MKQVDKETIDMGASNF